MNEQKITLNIPIYEILLSIGIILVVVGILAPFKKIEIFDFTLWFDPKLWVLSIPGFSFVWGYITRKILQNEKNSYILGFFLGLIGLIIALCKKASNSTKKNIDIDINNKYENLQKLNELKENGILTEDEFRIQKEKILK